MLRSLHGIIASSVSVFTGWISKPWQIGNAVYEEKNLSSKEANGDPYGMFWKTDGTRCYVATNASDGIHQFDVGTAWDLTTLEFVQTQSVSLEVSFPTDVFFKDDGTKMYVTDLSNGVFEYDLSVAWDISTAVYDSSPARTYNPGEVGTFRGAWFRPNGTTMYFCSDTPDAIYQYTLSSAWDVTSASYASKSKSVSTETTSPSDVQLSSDGTVMFVGSQGLPGVLRYDLSSAWDVSTAVYQGSPEGKYISTEVDISALGVVVSDDGTKLYIIDNTEVAFQYTLSPADDIAAASFSQSRTLNVESVPEDVFFKDDGTKMYIVGTSSDSVHQYALSTAWDVSTATYDNIAEDVSGQDTNPIAIFFRPTGLSMYILGDINKKMFQYTLSGAWDLSSSSFASKEVLVNDQETSPTAASISADGTKLYIVGTVQKVVYQYALSSAWDISTAVLDGSPGNSVSISSEDSSPSTIQFKSDGTKMYIGGDTNNKIFQYSLSIAWEVSSATYDTVSFDIAPEDTAVRGMRFRDNGTNFYYVGGQNDRVFQYKV
jgi:hypothetical protein